MPRPSGEQENACERETLPHVDFPYNSALRITKNSTDAGDLVQETCLKAYRFRDSYQQGTNIRAWVFRILENSSIDRYRKQARKLDMAEYDDANGAAVAALSAAGVSPDPQESRFDVLLDDEITEAIASTPGESRTVVIL